eukprot:Blabericola_migrator_1__3245@NODE_1956_length_3501_cov_965_186954_g1247_i0_p5_GENE_NODE_1956_length_3501_cov_965_186954_g1247_i0NODE_1956_length_3501_cov_965_186954_g1247_i0_p5_ORF_typecomplete_len130_score25_90Dynein_light/PF01221_18/1_1e26MCR_D/PF02505_14/1_3OAD_gamma/PF04277_13/0_31_NODE_1956_length_3501_cov_965_186954_g1247_i030033392
MAKPEGTNTAVVSGQGEPSAPSKSATKSKTGATPPHIRPQDVEVRNQDISDEHLQAAIEAACHAVSTYKTQLEVAEYIKTQFDEKFGPKWHCVVGRHFASHVSYEPHHYVYLKIGREVVLLFKTGGPSA